MLKAFMIIKIFWMIKKIKEFFEPCPKKITNFKYASTKEMLVDPLTKGFSIIGLLGALVVLSEWDLIFIIVICFYWGTNNRWL